MLIDTHCHLDLAQFDGERPQILARARAADVQVVVNPGIDLAHSRRAIALAERFTNVYAAVGVHPTSSGDFAEATVETLRQLAQHPKVVAVGEIGLDYYWETVEPAQQKVALRAQLALAAEVGLPVIIHSRNAKEPPTGGSASCYEEVADILSAWVQSEAFQQSPLAQRPFAGVLHAFGGDLALAEAAYSWNFVLGLGGPVTFKNAKRLQETVPQLRLDRLMLETDAPYLTPHPHRGERNEPAYVGLVSQQLAALYAQPVQEIARATTRTAQLFFQIPSPSGNVILD